MIAIAVHTADADSSESWLAPAMASPPKSLMLSARNIINTASGTNETTSDGCREVFIFVINYFIKIFQATKIVI
jgi:hypothetical protein